MINGAGVGSKSAGLSRTWEKSYFCWKLQAKQALVGPGKNLTFVGSYKLPLGQHTCIGQVVACSFQHVLMHVGGMMFGWIITKVFKARLVVKLEVLLRFVV